VSDSSLDKTQVNSPGHGNVGQGENQESRTQERRRGQRRPTSAARKNLMGRTLTLCSSFDDGGWFARERVISNSPHITMVTTNNNSSNLTSSVNTQRPSSHDAASSSARSNTQKPPLRRTSSLQGGSTSCSWTTKGKADAVKGEPIGEMRTMNAACCYSRLGGAEASKLTTLRANAYRKTAGMGRDRKITNSSTTEAATGSPVRRTSLDVHVSDQRSKPHQQLQKTFNRAPAAAGASSGYQSGTVSVNSSPRLTPRSQVLHLIDATHNTASCR